MKISAERGAKFIGCVVVLAGIMLLAGIFLPLTVSAANISDGGVDGEIMWEIYGSTLTLQAVPGSEGRMSDYYDRTAPWIASECAGAVKRIIVKYGVTKLGGASLGYDHVINTVSIPGSVDTIESSGPIGWDIRTLRFEEGVRVIDEWSFGNGIENLVLPESVTFVNIHAFGYPSASGWTNGIQNVYGYPKSAAEQYVGEMMRRVVYTRNVVPGSPFFGYEYAQSYDISDLLGSDEYLFLYGSDGAEFAQMNFCDRNIDDPYGDESLTEPEYETSVKTKKKQKIRISKKITTTVTYTTARLKQQSETFEIKARAKGKVTYKVTKGKKKNIRVTRKGKVTLKKGCKRGTYKIRVSAAETKDYEAAELTITVKVKNNRKNKKPTDPEPDEEDYSGFLKYVYTNPDGLVCFRYTGSGESKIVIPEGVHVIEGFSDETGFNDDITYIYIPSTVTRIGNALVFNRQDYGWDSNIYSVLYQCRNLQKVEVSEESLQFSASGDGKRLSRIGEGDIWSQTQRLPAAK